MHPFGAALEAHDVEARRAGTESRMRLPEPRTVLGLGGSTSSPRTSGSRTSGELPAPGGPDDFRLLVHGSRGRPIARLSPVARILWAIRWKLGELLGWDSPTRASGQGCRRSTTGSRQICEPPRPVLSSRRSPSPRCTCSRTSGPLRSPTGPCTGSCTSAGSATRRRVPGQMAVYVKPNGLSGNAYMSVIRPFRHLIVYPAAIRQIERTWRAVARSD